MAAKTTSELFETKVVKVDCENVDKILLKEAVELLQAGEVVAFPTETVYGLGANALDASAASKIYVAKCRPADNPLIVHVSSLKMLHRIVKEVPEKAKELMDVFWPGPLTILFPKADCIPDTVSTGLPTVAVRMPSHPIALALIEAADLPLAAPSANSSGRPSPTTAAHVLYDLGGRIPFIIDGGSSDVGVESTVLDVTCVPPTILRPGGVTKEALQKILPNVQVYQIGHNKEMEDKPPTPGMKYRHYSPEARVVLFVPDAKGTAKKTLEQAIRDRIQKELAARETPREIGVISASISLEAEEKAGVMIVHLETNGNAEDSLGRKAARGLFAALRQLDRENAEIIFVEGIPEAHEGLAFMNRIRKAASEVVSTL
eukprot:TRINITY_DN2385_c0_g1_i2.p1 TRINITY_DN2385_c0_g1~~TRINITY_DN2385_c0_g1_i2.p1  ORF type:complete len:374 (-),score=73.99 TRINITY_DN2385_c0_g1_i2:869-1990(-)